MDSIVTDLEWAMACSLALVSQKRYFGAKCFEILIKALQVATWYSWKREKLFKKRRSQLSDMGRQLIIDPVATSSLQHMVVS